MVELPVASAKWALVGRHICGESKPVHPYGEAAAMCSHVMPLQWERKCVV